MEVGKVALSKDINLWTKYFLEDIYVQNYSKNTYLAYKNQLKRFYDFCEENDDNFNMKTIKPMHLTSFFRFLQENSQNKLSSATQQAYYRTLRAFFKFISNNNDNLMDFDYLFKKNNIKFQKDEKNEINYLNKQEQDKLIDFFEKRLQKHKNYKNYRNLLLIKLMLFAGLRVSEVLNLKLKDFKNYDNDFYKIFILAKGGNEQSVLIRKAFIEREMEYMQNMLVLNSYVFKTSQDTPLDRINVYKTLNLAYDYCLIPKEKRGCHILRHSFAMNLLNKNVNIGIIQKTLRHKSIETTMIYANADEEMIKGVL